MNTKYLYGAIAVIIVLVVAFFLFNQNQEKNQTESATNTSKPTNSVENNSNGSNPNIPANTSTGSSKTQEFEGGPITADEPTIPDGNDIAVFEIGYNGTDFSSSPLTIKNGDVVIFKNNSDKSFWPASAFHPTHTNYPDFDTKKPIAPGQTWQFKFTKTGQWAFHDHLNPSATGKIIVQ